MNAKFKLIAPLLRPTKLIRPPQPKLRQSLTNQTKLNLLMTTNLNLLPVLLTQLILLSSSKIQVTQRGKEISFSLTFQYVVAMSVQQYIYFSLFTVSFSIYICMYASDLSLSLCLHYLVLLLNNPYTHTLIYVYLICSFIQYPSRIRSSFRPKHSSSQHIKNLKRAEVIQDLSIIRYNYTSSPK